MNSSDKPDVRAMRHQLHMAARGERLTKPAFHNIYSPAASLTRTVLTASEHQGLSGDDTMTWLAYELVQAYEKLFDQQLYIVNTRPMPPCTVTGGFLSPKGRDAGIEGAFHV